MKKYKKIGWLVIISTVLILFISQLFTLKEVYEHEKSLLNNTLEDIINANISNLNIQSIQERQCASYNSNKKQIRLIIDHLDTIIPIETQVNLDSINRIIGYDIRDSHKWNLETLAKNFNSHYLATNSFTLPYQLILTDSLGNILAQYPNTIQQIKSPDISLNFHLGYLDKHLLKAEFTFPLKIFFKTAGDRIVTSILLFIFILSLIYQLYLQLINEKRLRQNQEKFTHALVHNLRRPILNIKCQLENLLLNSKSPNDTSYHQAFSQCRLWSNKTLEDIENLLTFSVSAYGLKAYPQKINLQELMTQITTEYQQNNSIEKQIHIQTETSLPEPIVQADPLLLYGALGNLLGNAIKYSGPEVHIRISCHQEPRKLVLIVKDNGFGIPEEEQKYIFEEYSRGQRYQQDKQRKGFGLGLYYVSAVVKAHHGRILVNSDGEHGTEFCIEIPQKKGKK